MRKYAAELIGTFILVLFGCGTIVIAFVGVVGNFGVSLAFGFALIAAAYSIGPVSGCHINPAVSLGYFVADRLSGKDLLGYIISQCLGAVAASAVLLLIVKGKKDGYDVSEIGLGETTWGRNSGGFGVESALLFEFVASFLFVMVNLAATRKVASAAIAGLAIGLTLAAINLFGINITGASVNPARSLGPAIFVGGDALRQLWLYFAAPAAGGLLAGALYQTKLFGEDEAAS